MNKRVILYIAIIVLLLLALIAALFVIYLSFGGSDLLTNINPKASVETSVASGTEMADSETVMPSEITPSTEHETPTALPLPTIEVTALPSDTPEATQANPETGACALTGSTQFIFLAEDSNQGEPPFGAEMIRFMQINYDSPKVTLLGFPRYLELSTPDLYTTYGIREYTLGTIFHAVFQRVAQEPDAVQIASNAVGQAIYDNFGIVPEHYLTLKQESLVALVQLVGELQVENPVTFSAGNFEYPPGQITLTEQNIWEYFIYSAGPQDEYARLQRQNLVLEALFLKIQTQIAQTDFEQWLTDHAGLYTSDLSTEKLAQSFCFLYTTTAQQRVFIDIPENTLQITDSGMTISNPDEVQQTIDNALSMNE